VDSVRTYLGLQEKNYYIKILIIYNVNNPGPRGGGGHKVATAAALVEVAPPPEHPNSHVLPARQHCQQIAGGVWAARVVGSMSAGVQPRPVVLLLSPGVGAAGRCCVVALHCGPAVASGLHDTGLGVGHRRHLHGVGLAGAWVWGAVGTCPAWSGPGWCRGHWCDLAAPRNIEKTAALGDTACLGPWGQSGCVLCPGTSGRGLVCRVSCVVVPGASCSGLLSWVGVLCDVAARVGQ
jgi:hypothetical protein